MWNVVTQYSIHWWLLLFKPKLVGWTLHTSENTRISSALKWDSTSNATVLTQQVNMSLFLVQSPLLMSGKLASNFYMAKPDFEGWWNCHQPTKNVLLMKNKSDSDRLQLTHCVLLPIISPLSPMQSLWHPIKNPIRYPHYILISPCLLYSYIMVISSLFCHVSLYIISLYPQIYIYIYM